MVQIERLGLSELTFRNAKQSDLRGCTVTKILVTGSAGFFGYHLTTSLRRAGHQVVGFDLTPSKDPHHHDQFFCGDVRDVGSVSDAISGCEAVFHLAGIADIDAAVEDPIGAADVNVVGTASVLEACRRAGVGRFILASTVYVHSEAGSVYRTTKRAAEGLVWDCSELWGLRPTILRLGSLYGPRADSNNAVRQLISMGLRQGRIEFWGDGSEVREYIHVTDAARLAVRVLEERFASRSIHLAGRDRLTTREVVEMIAEIMGGGTEVSFDEKPFSGRYHLTPYSLRASRTSLGERLEDETFVDLGLGLLDVIENISDELENEREHLA